eukprot:s251_g20.t1
MSRQWHGRRNNEEDEDEEDSSHSSSVDRSSRSASDYKKGSIGPPPTYDGNREPGMFEEFRIRAKLWLFSTNIEARARGPRLMQALSGRAFESVRHLIDDSDWLDAPDNGEKLLELLSQPEYYGKEELESMYQSMHKLFFSDLRRDDDDLPAFRSRFEQAYRKVKKHKIELPPEALGFLFLKQAKIGSESFERIITMTNGDLKFDAVVDALRRLKMKLLDGGGDEKENVKKRHLWTQEVIDEEPNEGHADDDDLELIEQALADLDDDDSSKSHEITEDGAREILMTLIKQKVSKPVNMSYRQVQQQKREAHPTAGGHLYSINVKPDNPMQQFETFHYCTDDSYAVIDTGCQRSAIGQRTLDNIAARLPADLSIKFVPQKFRFTGIGGETVTNRVALIPVCFGRRPGVIRAAVLEDTPDAPFLLSLPIQGFEHQYAFESAKHAFPSH